MLNVPQSANINDLPLGRGPIIGSERKRTAIIIGAGVVGMATAYALAQRDIRVTVIEGQESPGLGASFANGAQLSYAYTDALASPAFLKQAAKIVVGLDPAILVRPTIDPGHLIWFLKFLRNTTSTKYLEKTLAGLCLGFESRIEMERLVAAHGLEFGRKATGKLHIHSNENNFASARKLVEAKRSLGAIQHILSRADSINLEPALADYRGDLVGSIHSPDDEVGDPHKFCREMQRLLEEKYQAVMRFSTRVRTLEDDGRSAWIETEAGEKMTADEIVLCAGIGAGRLGRKFGLYGAVMPMKGYSFTAARGEVSLQLSVTDVAKKVVLCPLEGKIRVAGLAEIAANNNEVDDRKISKLIGTAENILPSAANYDDIESVWAGVRPMSSDSLPIIKRISGRISANVGHGMLGWTYAMGSAERVAKIVTGERV